MNPEIQKKVEYSCESGLGIVQISDGSGNNLNMLSLQQLYAAVQSAIEDASAKIILLRSAESSFCLGMDLQGLEQSLESNAPQAQSESETQSANTAQLERKNEADLRAAAVALYSDLLFCIVSCSKPVIALVEGDVKAGGVGLSSACDIVIASDNASFELSEVLFGLIPYNVLPYLFDYRCSRQRFRYLVLTAARRSAAEAKQDGLVDEVFPQASLEKNLRTILKKMMRAEPEALARTKRYCNELVNMNNEFQTRRAMAQEAVLNLMHSPKVREGVEAFTSGRTPAWFLRFKPSKPISRGAFTSE